MAAPTSMSPAEADVLAGVADFAGDASFWGAGDCFPQPERKTASNKQTGAASFFLKIVCSVMGTKDFKQDNVPHQLGESSKLATKEKGRAPYPCPSVTGLKIESCFCLQADLDLV